MMIVTPSRSAVGMTRASPAAQFFSPSSSLIPARFPEKTICCGIPASFTIGRRSSRSFTIAS